MTTYHQKTFVYPFLANTLLTSGFALNFSFGQMMLSTGMSDGEIGVLVSVGVGAGILAKMVMGRYAVRFGLRFFWLLGLILFTLGSAGLAYLPLTGLFPWVHRVLLTSGYSLAIVAGLSYIQEISPIQRRTEILSTYSSSVFLGMLMGAITADVLGVWSTQFNIYSLRFSAIAILGLCALIFVGKTPMDMLRRVPPVQRVSRRVLLATCVSWTAWAAIGMGGAFSIVQLYLVRFAVESELHTTWIFFAAYTSSAIFIRVGLRNLSMRLDRQVIIGIGLLLYGAAQFSFPFITMVWFFIIPGILAGMGRALTEPSLVTFVADRVSMHDRAVGTATITLLVDIGLMILTPLYGFIIDHQSFHMMFAVAGGLLCVPGMLALIFYWQQKTLSPESK